MLHSGYGSWVPCRSWVVLQVFMVLHVGFDRVDCVTTAHSRAHVHSCVLAGHAHDSPHMAHSMPASVHLSGTPASLHVPPLYTHTHSHTHTLVLSHTLTHTGTLTHVPPCPSCSPTPRPRVTAVMLARRCVGCRKGAHTRVRTNSHTHTHTCS